MPTFPPLGTPCDHPTAYAAPKPGGGGHDVYCGYCDEHIYSIATKLAATPPTTSGR